VDDTDAPLPVRVVPPPPDADEAELWARIDDVLAWLARQRMDA
jgi:hypothetical protein